MIPGRNQLRLAMRLIRSQPVTLYRALGQAVDPSGRRIPAFAPGELVRGGSVQPVPAARYKDLGLNVAKQYVTWWAPTSSEGVRRSKAADEFDALGHRWALTSETPWIEQDGWVQLVGVRVD